MESMEPRLKLETNDHSLKQQNQESLKSPESALQHQNPINQSNLHQTVDQVVQRHLKKLDKNREKIQNKRKKQVIKQQEQDSRYFRLMDSDPQMEIYDLPENQQLCRQIYGSKNSEQPISIARVQKLKVKTVTTEMIEQFNDGNASDDVTRRKKISKKNGKTKKILKQVDRRYKINQVCGICHKNWVHKTLMVTLPCCHQFHKNCISEELTKKTNRCPNCKKIVFR